MGPPSYFLGLAKNWYSLSNCEVNNLSMNHFTNFFCALQCGSKLNLSIYRNRAVAPEDLKAGNVEMATLGAQKDYVINCKNSIKGKQMIFVAPEVRKVLEEIEEQV